MTESRKFACRLLLVTGLVVSAAAVSAQSHWPTTQFEVVSSEMLLTPGVVPQGAAEDLIQNFNAVLSGVDEWLVARGMDPTLARVYFPAEETRREIETYLSEVAVILESWGFPPPVLQVRNGRYRVLLAATSSAALVGMEAAGVYHPPVCGVLGGYLSLSAQAILSGDSMTPRGRATAAHELFHAVQANTSFFGGGGACLPPTRGSWITEGTADAIGNDLARRLRGQASGSSDEAWGKRDYARRLPVPLPLQLPFNVEWTEEDRIPYMTSSFWRFLGEYDASRLAGGQMPGPDAPGSAVDYAYLARMLARGGSGTDCVGSGAACDGELRWLDDGLRAVFGRSLQDLYPLFAANLALYATHRVGLPEALGRSWLDDVFDGCAYLRLTTEDPEFRGTLDRFEPVSMRCWDVAVESFEPDTLLKVEVKAPPSAFELADLRAAVTSPRIQTHATRLKVDPNDGWQSMTWALPLGQDGSQRVLFTNVAGDPARSALMRNLPITFRVIREYAVMGTGAAGGGGWSSITSADIDSPMPIELDRFGGYVFRGPHRQEGDQYISTQFTKGIDRPCLMVFDHLSNSETGDKVGFRMIQSGAITPGVYNFEDGTKIKNSFRITESDVPGFFLGGFQMGRVDPVLGGEVKYYTIKLGTLTIDSVAAGLVRGSLAAHGVETEYSKITGKEEEIDTKQIAVKFSIMATDPRGGPYRDQPYACLDDRARKTSQPSKGGGQPPGVKPDPETPSDPESSTGQGGFPPSDDDPAGTQGESEGKDTAEGRKAPASGGGNIIDRQGNWMHVTTTGTDATERLIADEEFHPIGVCNDKTPFSLALVKDGMPGRGFYGVSFDTEGIVPSGATGKFEVKNIKWDWGSIPPPGQPEDFPMRVSRKFAGPGTLTLKRHDGAMKNSRLEGSVQSGLLVESTGSGRVALKATFGFDMNCN